jgi:predicted nucleic acid-binding protein
LSIDLTGTLRKRKPDRRLSPLVPRGQGEISGLATLPATPRCLLLDTNVYINSAAGRLASRVRDALDQALLFHCSVALAELATGIAHADPLHPNWPAMRDHYAELFADIPASRLVTPDDRIWADAGVIAGTLARTQRFQPYQRKECLNDALIFVSASKAGIPVLTSNRDEFDLIQQLAPEGQFIHY